MTAFDVARKDFEDAIRSRAIWFASGVFLLALALGVLVPAFVFDDPDAATLVTFMQSPATGLVLPVVAVMLGYRSIVGERERGSVKFLLALPHSRRDVVLGILLGRTAVLAVAIVVGFASTAGLIVTIAGVPPIDHLAAFTLLTLLAGAAFVAISVGVSAMTASGTRAISVLVGGFVLATSLWERAPSGIHYLLVGEFPGSDPPPWVHLVVQLNPLEAYSTAAIAALPESAEIRVDVDDSGVAAESGALVGVPDSTFTEPWFVVGVLLAWIAAPLAVGYLRFRAADLG